MFRTFDFVFFVEYFFVRGVFLFFRNFDYFAHFSVFFITKREMVFPSFGNWIIGSILATLITIPARKENILCEVLETIILIWSAFMYKCCTCVRVWTWNDNWLNVGEMDYCYSLAVHIFQCNIITVYWLKNKRLSEVDKIHSE